MTSLVLVPLPDWSALEDAAAGFEAAPTQASEAALAAALHAFSERAEVLALFAKWLGGRPGQS